MSAPKPERCCTSLNNISLKALKIFCTAKPLIYYFHTFKFDSIGSAYKLISTLSHPFVLWLRRENWVRIFPILFTSSLYGRLFINLSTQLIPVSELKLLWKEDERWRKLLKMYLKGDVQTGLSVGRIKWIHF